MNSSLFLLLCLAAFPVQGAITITGIADKTKYDAPRSFTVTSDPNATVTTATLDGVATPIGSPVTVTAIGYHELKAESRLADGTVADAKTIRFIARDASRGVTEDGIPPHTPFRMVNDAPSAFAGQNLKVIAPASWPAGLPLPVAAMLRDGANETVRLNGVVTFGGLPRTLLPLRRGWGSRLAPAPAEAGPLNLAARLNGLEANRTVHVETAPVFTEVAGAIAANTTWPPGSRIRITGTITVNAGVTLTVGAGSIVLLATGNGTNGSAAEIVVNGTLQINGTEAAPVVLAPAVAGEFWGGIELPSAGSMVNAAHTMFVGSGEDATWFDTHSGYTTHKPHQALFLIAGSGAGTAIGAQLHLSDCFCFDLAGQQMNSRTNTWIDLQRTLMQRAITGGELDGSKVTIDRSALIEFPSEDAAFADADNDGIYLTNGDLSLTNSVIGFCKDDGIDSGANGGDNPFTAAADVTPYLCRNNWIEGTFHEGNSLSGTRNITYSGCVFFNCGQGVEAGYSASTTGNGPNASVDGCLFVSNMVAARWGDNYGSGYNYNATMEVKNSLLLNSLYRDTFSGQWHPTQANAWIYQTTATNSFGRPYYHVHDNYLSQPDPARHPANTPWNPANPAHAALLAPFMPVPGSEVGVAVSSYAPAQSDTAQYPGEFTVRLSSFSSRPVSVNWAVVAKNDPFGNSSSLLASGALAFAPGETLKRIAAPIANPGSYGLIHLALSDALNAEVTGQIWYFKSSSPDPVLVPRGSAGWRHREARSEPPAEWKQLSFNESGAEWLACTLPAGFGVNGVVTTVASGVQGDRTRAFYFRKRFTVPDPASIRTLTLRIRRDDAAVVWLNNESAPAAVSADGAFNPPYTYAMTGTANAVPNSSNTGNDLEYAIPVSNLVAGENLLAIEVHQTSLTSGDLLLDCELVAGYVAPFTLHLTEAGFQPTLYWPDPDVTLEETTDLQAWTPVPGAQSPLPLKLLTPRKFFRLRK
ncbi:MAG: right-handed parallel beta-helix repeat-containing protein [Verrucomicrobiota bacterium]